MLALATAEDASKLLLDSWTLFGRRSTISRVLPALPWRILLGCLDFNFWPTNGFSIKPLKVKLLAGEQKATEFKQQPHNVPSLEHGLAR